MGSGRPSAGLPDEHRAVEPPDPLPNSEVKRSIADGSVGFPHVRVGHRQASNETPHTGNRMGFFIWCWKYCVVSPDGKLLYVGSMYWRHIAIVDLERGEMIERLNSPELVRPFEFTQDESRLYVQLSSLHGFVEVNRETGERQTHYLPVPQGRGIPGERYPRTVNHGIELIKEESELWIASTATDELMVYSHPQLQHLKTIEVGTYPNAVTFNGDQSYAYTGNPRSNDVSVIDTASYEEIKRIPVQEYPQLMVVIDVPDPLAGDL